MQSLRVGGGTPPSGGPDATAAAVCDMATGGVAASVCGVGKALPSGQSLTVTT